MFHPVWPWRSSVYFFPSVVSLFSSVLGHCLVAYHCCFPRTTYTEGRLEMQESYILAFSLSPFKRIVVSWQDTWKSFWDRAMLRSKSMISKANLNYQLDAPLAFTRTLFNFVCPLWEIESSWHYAQIWWSICDDSCPGTDLVACQHVHVHDCLLKPLESSLLFCCPITQLTPFLVRSYINRANDPTSGSHELRRVLH